MNKTPVYLVTGFLGSGKTTFISQLLNFYDDNKKVAIVQNEFAPANFDGKELKRHSNSNFELLEINNSSVFCVCLLSDFISSLFKFTQQYQLDVLFIEASGLSDPIAIGQIFESPVLQPNLLFSGSICIVDAINFLKLSKLQKRIEQQVKIADSIILNKIDASKEDISKIENKLKSINPFANLHKTSYCNVPVNEILEEISNPMGIKIASEFPTLESSGRPPINSAVLKTTRPIKKDQLKTFLTDIAEQSIRMKGYIKTNSNELMAVQASYSNIQSEKIENNSTNQTELIVMSEKITVRELSNTYKSFC